MKHRHIVCTILAAAMCATPSTLYAQASSTSATPPMLQVKAIGRVVVRADTLTLSANINCRGKTMAEAEASDADAARRIVALVVAQGVAPDAVHITRPTDAAGFIGNEMLEMQAAAERNADHDAELPKANYWANRVISIKLMDLALGEKVRTALSTQTAVPNLNAIPTYSLSDDSSARRAATEQAVDKAKAQARDLAMASGYRLGPVRRIANYAGLTAIDFSDFDGLDRIMRRRIGGDPQEIEVSTSVSIDFDLLTR